MTAVDAPPGLPLGGLAAGEFAARRGPRRLARAALVYVVAVGTAALALARHSLYVPGIEILLVVPMFCMAVAGLGHAVRSARIRVDADGVRWGWGALGFRMRRARMTAVTAYDDAVALSPTRGSSWFLFRRDWDRFDDLPAALRRAGIGYERAGRRAPWRAQLQSYGIVLDLLLIGAALAVSAVALLVAVL